MGKYIEKGGLDRMDFSDSFKHIFDVKMRFMNRVHTEKFSIVSSELSSAKDLGLFQKNKSGYVQYLDWKPLGGATNLDGGVKVVEYWSKDDSYVYAHTPGKTYSLPIYLEDKIPRKDVILFGRRER